MGEQNEGKPPSSVAGTSHQDESGGTGDVEGHSDKSNGRAEAAASDDQLGRFVHDLRAALRWCGGLWSDFC